jgi:Ca-activated chloride channel family protein
MFEVIYPKLPVFEAYQTLDIDVDQLIKKALLAKARKDSLHQLQEPQVQLALQDSLTVVQQQVASKKPLPTEPQRGDPNLRGFASNNLVFLLDISASMSDSNKLPLLKTALRQLLDLMRPEDNITFITYSGKAKVVLEPTSAQYKKSILKAIENLQSGGVSDADEGIQLAYKTIQKNWIDAGNNRIILATDGAFNVKKSTKKLILKGSKEKENICLSVFYFSQKEYPHHKELLVELSENGRGKYSYIQKENAEQILLLEAQAVRTKK